MDFAGSVSVPLEWGAKFVDKLPRRFHNVGLLWTPTGVVFEVDGQLGAPAAIGNSVKGPANVRLPHRALGQACLVRSSRGHEIALTRFAFMIWP